MSSLRLSFRAFLEDYEKEAVALFAALKAGEEAARWRFKWLHPRFRGGSVEDVEKASLELSDARAVIAREYGFESWTDTAAFAAAVRLDGPVARFETAVEAVISGDAATLRSMLRESPELVNARSMRRHRATLLHYTAANGVEDGRQRTPGNAVEMATILLDAGAQADAVADMYGTQCTTLSMLVSSCHPANAGLQGALAETLLDYGAALVGPGSKWQSALMTALAFGYPDTARTLVRRGAAVDSPAAAAGLGRMEDLARLLPCADPQSGHEALALAAMHGHTEAVRLLLDAEENPDRYNPEGLHSHSTPLHQAALAGHAEVVRLLVDRGARLDIRDALYQGTPLDWALHGNWTEVADWLRSRSAPPPSPG